VLAARDTATCVAQSIAGSVPTPLPTGPAPRHAQRLCLAKRRAARVRAWSENKPSVVRRPRTHARSLNKQGVIRRHARARARGASPNFEEHIPT